MVKMKMVAGQFSVNQLMVSASAKCKMSSGVSLVLYGTTFPFVHAS